VKEDVGLSLNSEEPAPGIEKWDPVGTELMTRFDDGEGLRVTVLSIMGKELVISIEHDPDA
jgi:hypothetical protein